MGHLGCTVTLPSPQELQAQVPEGQRLFEDVLHLGPSGAASEELEDLRYRWMLYKSKLKDAGHLLVGAEPREGPWLGPTHTREDSMTCSARCWAPAYQAEVATPSYGGPGPQHLTDTVYLVFSPHEASIPVTHTVTSQSAHTERLLPATLGSLLEITSVLLATSARAAASLSPERNLERPKCLPRITLPGRLRAGLEPAPVLWMWSRAGTDGIRSPGVHLHLSAHLLRDSEYTHSPLGSCADYVNNTNSPTSNNNPRGVLCPHVSPTEQTAVIP